MLKNAALASWLEPIEPFLGPLAGTAQDFTALTGVPVDLPETLFLRAELTGLTPPGRTSAGGSCRLLPTTDGWAAVNLARPDDTAALPALVALLGSPGAHLTEAAAGVTAAEVARSAQLLGIPAAELGAARESRAPVLVHDLGRPRLPGRRLRIVDFSALWAGPLCARLLGLAGAEVVKVESTTRPDGARSGSPDFYRRLHDGHGSLVLDFSRPGPLAEVVAGADVVIEASRPRALRRLGVHAERFLADRPGRVWVGITGYGREDDRVAFGDDAAVAGGLAGRARDGSPVFLGDALADPVTGVFAAHAAARSLARGGGELLCVSMAACAAALAESAPSGRRPC